MRAPPDRRQRGRQDRLRDNHGCHAADRPADDRAGEASVDDGRRNALRAIGSLSVYVAPAMTVLLPGRAGAHHESWHKSSGNGGSNCRGWAVNPGCSAF